MEGSSLRWKESAAGGVVTLIEMGSDIDRFISGSPRWSAEMSALRPILLKAGLSEEIKWAKPCFVDGSKNIAIMQPMREFLALMFFQGALLADPDGILEEQGPNSRSAKRLCIRSTADVKAHATAIRSLVAEARTIAGEDRPPEPVKELVLVAELQHRLDGDRKLREAFAGLTPGRQREYDLHISGAKQAATRESRIDRCVDRILAGKGLRDR